ncbi:MAG TPA: protein kinase [Polyangiaceae bacterium]|nr:protein kinase [Polyangiaceae bacterium]
MTAPSPRRGSEGRKAPADVDLLGTKYRVIGPLGRGGMGLVYEVEHRDEGSRWAAKVLAHELSDRRDLVKRLHFEAEVLGRLQHPNLVRVVEAGTSANGRVYYVMELLRGKTLREALLDVVAYAPAAACRLVLQLLAGLGAAHQAGLIHRDIKPENVFVCEGGRVVLLDFGIAKNVYAMPAGAPLTPVSGPGVVGTLRYAAPECIEGKRATLLSDIYSAGAVFWELLTGRLPFNFESRFQMFSAIVHQGLPPLGDVRPGLPADLCALVGRAAALAPGARFPSVVAFAEATRLALARVPEGAPEPARPPRVRAAPTHRAHPTGAGASYPGASYPGVRGRGEAGALQNDTEVDLLAPTMTPPLPEPCPDSAVLPDGELVAEALSERAKPAEPLWVPPDSARSGPRSTPSGGARSPAKRSAPPGGAAAFQRRSTPPGGAAALERRSAPPWGAAALERRSTPPGGAAALERHSAPPEGVRPVERRSAPPESWCPPERCAAPPEGPRAAERRSAPPASRGRAQLLLERLRPKQADKVFLDVEELARRNPDWAEALLDSRGRGDGAGDGGEQS